MSNEQKKKILGYMMVSGCFSFMTGLFLVWFWWSLGGALMSVGVVVMFSSLSGRKNL